MIRCAAIIGLITAVVSFSGDAKAEDKEPSAVVEIGGASEWGLRDGSASFGPTVAVEVTPLKNWLEIEAGVTPLFSNGHTEWDTDLLFKKPFTLSNTVEFMLGVGPEWVHATGSGTSADSIAGEAVLDFMFWPSPERELGWYLEPSYSYDSVKGTNNRLASALACSLPFHNRRHHTIASRMPGPKVSSVDDTRDVLRRTANDAGAQSRTDQIATADN